jgi:hypothetical protein
VISAALLAVLAFATLINLSLLASMRPDVAHVFDRALARSSLLATVPLTALWFLERRERATPWLFAAAFLWGGCIATGLALPFNTAFFMLADLWVAQHPAITQVLGPDAAMMLAAPLPALRARSVGSSLAPHQCNRRRTHAPQQTTLCSTLAVDSKRRLPAHPDHPISRRALDQLVSSVFDTLRAA